MTLVTKQKVRSPVHFCEIYCFYKYYFIVITIFSLQKPCISNHTKHNLPISLPQFEFFFCHSSFIHRPQGNLETRVSEAPANFSSTAITFPMPRPLNLLVVQYTKIQEKQQACAKHARLEAWKSLCNRTMHDATRVAVSLILATGWLIKKVQLRVASWCQWLHDVSEWGH